MNNLLVHARRITGVAVVLAVIALHQSWLALAAIKSQRTAREDQHARLEQWRALNAGSASQRAAVNAAAAELTVESRLETLIAHHFAGLKVERTPPESVALDNGLHVRQHEVRIDQVTPLRLGQFLAGCESTRPPVRVAGIQITSPRGETARSVHAQLTLLEIAR